MVTTRAQKLKESEETAKLENNRKLRSGSKGTKEGMMEMRASNRKQESGIRKRAKHKEKMENSTTFKQKQEREKGREEGPRKRKLDKEKDNEEMEEEKRAWQMLEKRIKRSENAYRDKKRRNAKKIEGIETGKKNLKLFIAKLIEDSVGQTNDLGCAWAALAGGSYDHEFKERMKQAIRSLCLENPESYSFIASDNIMGELLWLAAIFRRILLVQKWDSEIVDLVRTAAHRATDRLVYEVKEISKILDLASGIHSETWNDSSQVWNDESQGKVEELIRYIDWWMVNSGSLKESLDSWLKNSEGEIYESCKVVGPQRVQRNLVRYL